MVILGIATMSLAGCSSDEPDTTNGVLIEVWMPEQQAVEQEVYDNAVESYNLANAGVSQLKIVYIPRGNGYEYENKINAGAASQELPDAIFMDGPTVANYVHSSIIQPIGQYFSQEELDEFVPSIITQGTVNGELYAVGPSESSVVLYCNKDVFDAAGIEIPQTKEEAWTWKEVYEYAKLLQTDEMRGINLTWDLGEGQIYGLAPILWSNGASLVDATGTKAQGYVNSPESIEALELYQKFAVEGLMDLQALPDEFANGGSAMFLMGSWEYANLVNNFPELNFAITYYPTSNADIGVVSPSGDWAWGLTSSSENPDLTADVIKYLTSEEIVSNYANAINKPASRIAVLDKQEIHPIIKEQVKTTAHPRPISTSYPVLSSEFSTAMQDIRIGSDIQQALDTVATRFETDIKRNK